MVPQIFSSFLFSSLFSLVSKQFPKINFIAVLGFHFITSKIAFYSTNTNISTERSEVSERKETESVP